MTAQPAGQLQHGKQTLCPIARLAVMIVVAAFFIGAKSKKESEAPEKESSTTEPHVDLPADLNEASLRVAAIDTMYQLDLSSAQLQLLRTASADTASHQKRTVAKADAKLTTALSELAGALLGGNDDTRIADLRNQVVELSNAAQMDDEVQPSDTAEKAAPEFAHHLTASQVAAYLAFHADQVTDPAERMVGAIAELHESSGAGGETTIHNIGDDIAHMVDGFDETKASALADKVVVWLKSNRDLKEEEVAARQSSLEESARKVLGDVNPMDVLTHWLDAEVAQLLANPQLPEALAVVIAAKQQTTTPNQ